MPSSLPPRATTVALERLAVYLLQMQTPDGALPNGLPGEPGELRVIPYFANFGAWGLAIAGEKCHQPAWWSGVRRWLEWNDARRNPDGTIYDYKGRSGSWVSTNHYDSTDSYASTYLELIDVYSSLPLPTPDRLALPTRLPFARKSVDAMLLTQQKNGLTIAHPNWPVMYTMDNTEVLRGLRAGERFFKSESGRDPALAARCAREADRVTEAIARDLWDAGNECYIVGLQTDGGKMAGLQKWYPDIMANLMAIGWLPSSPVLDRRARPLYEKLARTFADNPDSGIPAAFNTEGEMERLIWWGYAALAQRDTPRIARIQTMLSTFDPARHKIVTPANLGHAIRILAAAL